MDQINHLLQYTNKAKSVLIFYTKDFCEEGDRVVLLKYLEKWLEAKDKRIRYEYIISDGGLYLLQNKIREFHRNREPVIIPTSTKGHKFEDPRTPAYVVNIGNRTNMALMKKRSSALLNINFYNLQKIFYLQQSKLKSHLF